MLQTPPSDRTVFLRDACGGDVEFYKEALQMVEDEESMGSFHSAP